MKNRNFIKNSMFGLLVSSLGLVALLNVHQNPVELKGYDGISLTKMDIDLNDTSSVEIRDYYSALNNKNENEKKGSNLLKNLKSILKEDQLYFDYDSSGLWKLYEITDRDWEKSPASAISNGTYDSNKNVIKDYNFSTAKKNPTGDANPYVRALYMDRSISNPVRAWGNHSQDGTGINQEHIWPKSHGFDEVYDESKNGGARGDPMHLWPGNGYANNIHSNDFYGYVDKSKSYKNTKTKYDTVGNNYSGISLTIGEGTVFEPQDSDKGDIARACFYMVARYNNYANAATGIDANDPNLILNDDINLNVGTSTSSNPFNLGVLSDLLEWNRLDPPDEFEIHRNNLLYTNFTHNRNPFIDFPQWADIAFGSSTKSANPQTDSINFNGDSAEISSISVTKNPIKTSYVEGETFDPTGMVVKATYSDGTTGTIKNYSYTPSDELVFGTTSITISYQGCTTTVSITVSKSSGAQTKSLEKVTTETNGKYLIISENVGVLWKEVSSDSGKCYTLSKDDSNNYVYSTDYDACLWDIDFENGYVSGPNGKYIGANSDTNSLETSDNPIANNVSIDASGNLVVESPNGPFLRCNRNVTSGNPNPIFKFYKSSSYTGQNPVQIYKIKTVIEDIHPTSITVNPTELEIDIDETTKLDFTVLPNDASNKEVTWSSSNEEVAIVSENGEVTALSAGTAIITATSKDTASVISGSCEVTVPDPIIVSRITLSGTYKTNYYVGDVFETDGLIVTAHYSQGGQELADTEDVTEFVNFTGYDMESEGNQTVTVHFGDVTTTYSIEVANLPEEENTILFVATQFDFDNAQSVDLLEKDDFSISFSGKSKYYNIGESIRVYGGDQFTITGKNKIVGVSFTFGSGDSTSNEFSVDSSIACDETIGLWSNINGVDSITYTISGTTGHRRINQIHIQYDPNSETDTSLSSIELSGNYKTSFYTDDVFTSEGLIVTAKYANNTSKVVSPTSITGYDLTVSGQQTVTVSYTDDNKTATATYNISVTAVTLSKIEISGEYQTKFTLNDIFNHDGAVVTATFNSGKTANVTSDAVWSAPDMSKVSDSLQITVSYTFGGTTKNAHYNISISKPMVTVSTTYVWTILPSDFVGTSYSDNNIDKTSQAVDVDDQTNLFNIDWSSYQVMLKSSTTDTDKMQFQKNNGLISNITSLGHIDSITLSDSEADVNVYYGDSLENVTSSTLGGSFFKIQAGNSTVYLESIAIRFTITETYDPTKILSSISLDTSKCKTEFNLFEEFSSEGLVVTANYENGETETVSPSQISGYDSNTAGEQTITVKYVEHQVSAEATYKVIVKADTKNFVEASGEVQDGYYLIGYSNAFLSAEISNDRALPITCELDNSIAKAYNPKCIWKIKNNGEYYTIFNEYVSKYLGSNSSSKVRLESSVTDTTKWSLEVSSDGSSYCFVNQSNVAGGKSAYLRINDTSKLQYFAFYAKNENQFTKLYRLEDTVFTKVSDASWIKNGDKLVMSATNNSKQYSLLENEREYTNYITASETTYKNGTISTFFNDDLLTFEVISSGDNFILKTKDKYVKRTSSSPYFALSENISDAALVDFVNDDGKVKISSVQGSTYLKFNFPTTGPRFGFYAQSTGIFPTIYMEQSQGEVYKWCSEFLTATYNCALDDWNNFANSYKLLCNDAKKEISEAIADQKSESIASRAMARYDYIVSDDRFNVSAFLLNRGTTSSRNVSSISINNMDPSIIAVITFSVIGLSTIFGYYMFERKRIKQN